MKICEPCGFANATSEFLAPSLSLRGVGFWVHKERHPAKSESHKPDPTSSLPTLLESRCFAIETTGFPWQQFELSHMEPQLNRIQFETGRFRVFEFVRIRFQQPF